MSQQLSTFVSTHIWLVDKCLDWHWLEFPLTANLNKSPTANMRHFNAHHKPSMAPLFQFPAEYGAHWPAKRSRNSSWLRGRHGGSSFRGSSKGTPRQRKSSNGFATMRNGASNEASPSTRGKVEIRGCSIPQKQELWTGIPQESSPPPNGKN